MSTCIPCTRHLEPTQIFTLAEAAPALVTVMDGTLWLTGGDDVDIILAVGDCVEIESSESPVGTLPRPLSAITISALDAKSLARAA